MTKVVVDANLLIIYSIGKQHPEQLGKHRRAKEYMPSDFSLLMHLFKKFESILITPNAVTECSDLFGDSQYDKDAKRSLKELIELPECIVAEKYVPSVKATARAQYDYLGVADCAMLCLVNNHTVLLSTDRHLVTEAQKINADSINFNYYRNFTTDI